MKLNRSIKILALGAVVALNLITPAFADEAVDTSKRALSSQKLYSIQKTMAKKNMDPEQMKERLEIALEKLQTAYEEGRIDQEKYDVAKASIEEKLEKIENGDYSFMEERKDKRNMDPEQMKERLEKTLEKLESAYEEGKIDEERYEASKASIEENLEKIENGDYSFKKRPIEKRDIDPEKMQAMLENALEKLEKAYQDGKITEERYDSAKLHIEEKLEELDN